MKQERCKLKGMPYAMLALTLTFFLVIPINPSVNAANPSQIFQITIDDGDIIGLGLILNKAQSFIITEFEPYEVNFIYGDQAANYLSLTIYFYTTDQTSYFQNESLMYDSNIVENTVYYRIISHENGTSRYALLYADQPQLGTHKHGIISFLDGNTLVGVGGTLDSDTYSDGQLQTMLSMVEAKARELLSMKGMNELQGKITGFSRPMKHIKISLLDGNTTTETTTDAEGNYNITKPFSKGMQYTLIVTFSYALNTTTYFSLHYRENNASVVTYRRTFTVSSLSDLTQNIALDTELPLYFGGDWAKTFASMYVHFTEALEFYMVFLHVDVNFQLPVDVYTFVPKETGTRYWYNVPGKSYITIDAEKSTHETPYRPMNREYHEFSHYIMHTLYQTWPAPSTNPDNIEERNHDGYLNPSTSDSYVEGFAEFMSAVIMEYSEQTGTIPMTLPNEKDMGTFGAMDFLFNTQWNWKEINCPAWADSGKAEETAVAGTLWDLFDDPTDYCKKSPEQMYELYQQDLPQIHKEYAEFKETYEYDAREQGEENVTAPPLKILTLEDFQKYKYDDDNVTTIQIQGVWDIIKNFHNDFTSVYNDFITKYPDQKKAIDEVFIAHAFYVDTDPGNGVYDLHDMYRDENHNKQYDAGEYYVDCPIDEFHYTNGEKVGQATNYNRLWRQSIQEVPGYFIKVENTVPFYLVKVSFPNNFYLDYMVRVWNDNGLINIPVPPKGYVSLITVIPEGVQSSVPLSFASDVFQRHYNTSLTQGYYVEHDFQVTGPIPTRPSMPSDLGGTAIAPGQTTKTPGFELLVLFAACALVIFLSKKTKRP
jgi:hypothetical protein